MSAEAPQLTLDLIADASAAMPASLWLACSHQEQMFVACLLADPKMNQAAAALASGASSSKTRAKKTGSEIALRPHVKAAIAAAIETRAKRLQLTQDWVVDRLRDNVDRAMQAEPVRDKQGQPTGEYTYQGAVANQSLNLIGKHLGMFADRLKVGIEDPEAFAETLRAMPKDQRKAFILKALAGK